MSWKKRMKKVPRSPNFKKDDEDKWVEGKNQKKRE